MCRPVPDGGDGGSAPKVQRCVENIAEAVAKHRGLKFKWLYDNFEPHADASLPRCTLYEHYRNHCRETGLAPVNAASFGKLIRSSFKGLQTRRLGTRGNSKYHYSGGGGRRNTIKREMDEEE